MRGVFLDLDSVDRGDLDLQRLHASLDAWEFHPGTEPHQVAARIAGARVVVTNKVRLDGPTLQSAPGLELVCLAATGADNVDLEAARRLGIAVANVRGYCTASVVQHVFALLLALTTRLPEYSALVRAGGWQHSRVFCPLEFPVRELAGRVMGIVGHGELGRAVAAAAGAFGMAVRIAHIPGRPGGPGRIPLDELLPEVDVLSLHCPLTPSTRNLIDARALARMRADAILVNTARGGIVDEHALARALREGRLGGAGIDVLGVEPPVDGNPLLDPDLPNLVVTPHTAWSAREARQRAIDQIAGNIRAFRAGTRRNRLV